MFEYIHPKNGPVIEGLEMFEVTFARDQPQYIPLRTLRSRIGSYREVLSRWTFTPEQRAAIAAGADIFLELSTFGQPLQPIRLSIIDRTDNLPDYFAGMYGLVRPSKEGFSNETTKNKASVGEPPVSGAQS